MLGKKNHRLSILIKLLLTMLLTLLAVNCTLFWGFKLMSQLPAKSSYFLIHAESYIDYLANDFIDDNGAIDTEAIGEIEEKLAVKIQIEDRQQNNLYGDKNSSIDLFKNKAKKIHTLSENLWLGFARHSILVGTAKGPYQLLFMSDRFKDFNNSQWQITLVILSSLSLLIGLCYFFIRRFLAPIKKIDTAVQRIANGDLDVNLTICSKDEFGDLANSFNVMTEKLRQNIGAQQQLMIDVSHELRSPIARIKLAAEMSKDPKSKEEIIEDARELETLTGNILDGAKLEFAVLQEGRSPINLGKSLAEVYQRYDHNKIKIDTLGIEALPTVLGSNDQLQLVLKNLLDNALKYSPNDKPIVISPCVNDGLYGLTVSDSGPGIDAAELAKVFEPFYRADPSRTRATGGYGLGLYISQKAVAAMKGRLSLHNSGNGLDASIILEPA